MIIAMERGIKLRIELSNIIMDNQTPYILGSGITILIFSIV